CRCRASATEAGRAARPSAPLTISIKCVPVSWRLDIYAFIRQKQLHRISDREEGLVPAAVRKSHNIQRGQVPLPDPYSYSIVLRPFLDRQKSSSNGEIRELTHWHRLKSVPMPSCGGPPPTSLVGTG